MLIDNDKAARVSCEANSASPTMKAMCRFMCEIEARFPAFIWYERVCSFSNCADKPSRGEVDVSARELSVQGLSPLVCENFVHEPIISMRDRPYRAAPFLTGATH